ncbi:hypothetical protein ELI41_16210 [Rhizobium leguminosarum]|nr:hypothetical protein ELI41_16210 [Rhizobium leguminosarum]TAV54625.1 hypothetical protein ELI29_16905 [Rhizobium leguminosarum]
MNETTCRAAPSSACRHLLPAGEKRFVATLRFPLPPSGGAKDGSRPVARPRSVPDRADEGAPNATFRLPAGFPVDQPSACTTPVSRSR